MKALPSIRHSFWWVCFVSLFVNSAYAQDACDPVVGQLMSVEGRVEVQRSDGSSWFAAELNADLCQGDTIRVGERSRAAVALINQTVLRIDQGTTIRLVNIVEQEEERSLLSLLFGAFQSFSRQPRELEVDTPYLNGAIEGTEFVFRVDDKQTTLTVLEGRILASNDQGRIPVAAGQSAVAQEGAAPQLRTLVRPLDAVQWALYYPPVLSLRSDWSSGNEQIRRSLQSYRSGDLSKALESIVNVPDTVADPRFFVYRASLLLAVGRPDEAGPDIERALSLTPNDSDALALKAVIAVAQNENKAALDSAQRAVQANPQSATALIALSYAQQANFDLEGARASLEQAVQAESENALAWARLAELYSSFGRLSDALDAANKAASLEPGLSRTQTVLGFAYLTQLNTEQAKNAFQKAIELEQGDPLPRLGFGLAKIKEGELSDGRRELDVAASLDPNDAIIRSYLGKAYYEEKRAPLDEKQYEIAKNLDPNDPTPWFYDAIAKQTSNRPVEALQDLQTSIDLNDNRAVYRSRLLLDSDLAARSASQARIYSDLGFQQLALVEGWKSVNADPSNYSAHRFLADSYSALPRHEIARVSELLQSQLLQPLNMTPIQPQLAESNLFLISASGPTAISFFEFNPLFNRDGLTFQGNGLAGGNNTYSQEGVFAGIYDNIAFSVGASHFETDGWRTNADQDDDIANAFIQVEISPETSIQAEYRYRETERGDLQLRYFPEDFFPGQRNNERRNTYRLGTRHAFSPDSILLGSFIYQDVDFDFSDDQLAPPVTSFEAKRPEEAFSTEIQYLFRSQYVNLRTGAGYSNINGQFNTDLSLFIPPPGPGLIEISESTGTDLEHTNFYAYSDINYLENVTTTVGFSADFIRSEREDVGDEEQFNPKFGITWNPFSGTTLRAAAFRVLKRTLITDQTLEPTQIAGFNQFFDDFNGTESWIYGGAIDQKITNDLFGGVQFSKRDLNVPFLDIDDIGNPIGKKADANEELGIAYLFWTPHEWLALRTEYIYERFESNVPGFPTKLDTHRVPLGISFFHPSGLSASLTATYWNQKGEDFPRVDGSVETDSNDFWTADVALNYRLPKRYGFITVGATNLFDEQFKFFDTDIDNPRIQPDRTFFARITLAFP